VDRPNAGPLARALSAAVGVVNVALLYRRITSIATITVALWARTMIAVVAVIATGVRHFDPHAGLTSLGNRFNADEPNDQLNMAVGIGARLGAYEIFAPLGTGYGRLWSICSSDPNTD